MRGSESDTHERNRFQSLPRTRARHWVLLLATLLAVVALDLSLGSVLIPLKSVIGSLLGDERVPPGWREIVLLFRLPRTVTAMLGGAALGIAGLKMQTLFRNPLVSILLQFSQEYQMQSYLAWTFGSFGGVTWKQMPLFAATLLAGLALAWMLAKPLNGFLLGEGYARSMGVNVRRTRYWIILGASLLAGCVTAYCGPIGFLGIAVPHLGRLLFKTSDHHVLVPAVILVGAILALTADLLSQVPGTRIALPLNAVTSLIGAPVVVGVILRRQRIMEAGA